MELARLKVVEHVIPLVKFPLPLDLSKRMPQSALATEETVRLWTSTKAGIPLLVEQGEASGGGYGYKALFEKGQFEGFAP